MARRLHHDGTCSACGRVGATWEDLAEDVPPESLPALCDRCEEAQRRWDDWEYCTAHGHWNLYWTAHCEGPPKSPPVRR